MPGVLSAQQASAELRNIAAALENCAQAYDGIQSYYDRARGEDTQVALLTVHEHVKTRSDEVHDMVSEIRDQLANVITLFGCGWQYQWKAGENDFGTPTVSSGVVNPVGRDGATGVQDRFGDGTAGLLAVNDKVKIEGSTVAADNGFYTVSAVSNDDTITLQDSSGSNWAPTGDLSNLVITVVTCA